MKSAVHRQIHIQKCVSTVQHRLKIPIKKRGCPRDILAGVGGVEPPITESKSVALPLGYTPIMENGSYPANRIDLCKKMGRVVGVEPTHNGATIRRVDRFTIAAIFHYNEPKGSNWQLPILPARLHASTFGL